MKILLCIDNLARGGRERRIVELIKGLLATKSFVISLVVFSDRVDYDEIFEMDLDVHLLPRIPKKDPRIFFKFFSLCKKAKPELIHSWGDMATIYAIPAAQLLHIKLYNGSVADAPKTPGWFNTEFRRKKITTPFSYKIIGNSIAGLTQYKIPVKKAVCIYNGFDFNRARNLKPAEEIRNELNITTKNLVGMVGAFHKRKDYTTFLAAAKLIIDQGYDVSFLAVGEGEDREKLMLDIDKKYQKQIIFTGLRKDIESIIQALDIGVLATNSEVHGEGISNAILEFMALGKPVIATDGGGTPEIIRDQDTGFIVKAKSPEIMAEKIQFLLDNPAKSIEMGELGKARIYEAFNLDNMAKAYVDLYNSKD